MLFTLVSKNLTAPEFLSYCIEANDSLDNLVIPHFFTKWVFVLTYLDCNWMYTNVKLPPCTKLLLWNAFCLWNKFEKFEIYSIRCKCRSNKLNAIWICVKLSKLAVLILLFEMEYEFGKFNFKIPHVPLKNKRCGEYWRLKEEFYKQILLWGTELM